MRERETGSSLLLPALLVTVAIVLVYGRAVTFDFVWDDRSFLVENESIRSLSNIPSFFLRDADRLYRPLRTTHYALAHRLFGPSPGLHHAMGLLLHIAASLLVLWILKLWTARKDAAWFGALVFALHPVHIEKFVFVTAAFDIPADLCVLLALWSYCRLSRSQPRTGMVLSGLLYGTGLFFAENAAVYPLLWGLVELARLGAPPERRRDKIVYGVALVLIFSLYLLVRTVVLGWVARAPMPGGYWVTQSVMMTVYLVYWHLLAIPYPLSPLPPIHGPVEALCLPCALAALPTLAALVLAWRVRREAPLVSLGILWFYAALLPNSNLVPTGTLMAERYLYLPSVGAALLASVWFSRAGRFRLPVAAAVLAALAALSAYQTPVWRNGESLWTHAISLTPDSARAWTELGVFYREDGQREKAVATYRTMLRRGIRPDAARAELAAFAIDERNYVLAEELLAQVEKPGGLSEIGASNLVVARCQLNRPGWQEEAQRALDRFPSAFLYEQVGNCFARIGGRQQALASFAKALELDPRRVQINDKIERLQRGTP